MKQKLKLAAISLAILGSIGTAQATALVIDNLTANVDVITGAEVASWGSTLLGYASTLVSTASWSGEARSAVYQSASGLDFYYQFTNDANSQTGVERFTGYDFTSIGASVVNVYQTAASWDSFVAGSEQSEYADRTAAGVIGFSFVPNGDSKIEPGTTSYTQIVRTNATNFGEGNFGLLNGHAGNAVAFAPLSAVPEPETYGMLLAGLALVGSIARRRKAKQG